MGVKQSILFLGIFFLLLSSCGQKNNSGNLEINKKQSIINGLEVTSSDPIAKYTVLIHSYQVSKNTDPKPNGFSLCTGVIIGKKTILTAAHCLSKEDPVKKISVMEVFFGLSSETLKNAPKAFGTLVSPHPYYKSDTLSENFDLAVVKLATEIPSGFSPISILPSEVELQVGDMVFPAGYGRSTDLGVNNAPTASYRLNKSAGLRISEDWGTFFYVDQVKGSGVCSGDSGGPTFVQSKGRLYLVGITHGFAIEKGKPSTCLSKGMLVKVQTYKAWILKTMGTEN